MSDGSQLPITPAPENPMSLAFTDNANLYINNHTNYIYKIYKYFLKRWNVIKVIQVELILEPVRYLVAAKLIPS